MKARLLGKEVFDFGGLRKTTRLRVKLLKLAGSNLAKEFVKNSML
jgi:hypothetical protein